jgi:competence protein ComGC
MLRDSKGISIYMIISIIGALALAFILILPQVMDVQKKENTEKCIKNMRELENAVKRYMYERDEDFVGDTTDLFRNGYLRKAVYVCPAGTPESRYFIQGNKSTGTITVTCPLQGEHPSHVLPTVASDN